MLMLLYPLEGELEGYSRDQFLADLCDEVDVKPKHGSPDFARDVAMQKIAARLEGARLAREALVSGCGSPVRRRASGS